MELLKNSKEENQNKVVQIIEVTKILIKQIEKTQEELEIQSEIAAFLLDSIKYLRWYESIKKLKGNEKVILLK